MAAAEEAGKAGKPGACAANQRRAGESDAGVQHIDDQTEKNFSRSAACAYSGLQPK
jgi:hypothetical protein